MSFILDALRKSEQERQIASGRGAGLLYPLIAENNPKPGVKALLLAVVLCSALAAAAFWWLWPKPPAEISNSSGHSAPGVAEAPARSPVRPSPAPVVATPASEASGKAATAAATSVPAKSAVDLEPGAKKRRAPGPAAPIAPAVAPPAARPEAEAPKGLPVLSITGYINDQDGTRLVIINDNLLREGDEVAPGLRLERILDDAAVFSYKGQRFRR